MCLTNKKISFLALRIQLTSFFYKPCSGIIISCNHKVIVIGIMDSKTEHIICEYLQKTRMLPVQPFSSLYKV